MDQPQKILFLALSGIGNLIMQLPTIKTAKKLWPDSHITVWVAPRGTRALATNEPDIDTVFEAPIKNNLGGHLQTVNHLREQKFDTAVMLSPGQQLKGSLYMYLASIPVRVAHQYPFQGNPHSSLLLTHSRPEQEHLHDLEQNLNLLKTLDIGHRDLEIAAPYALPISSTHEKQASQILSQRHLSNVAPIIGLHPGSAPSFTWKRWPLQNWAELAAHLITNHQAHILIFGGPDEQDQNQQLQEMILKHTSPSSQPETPAPPRAKTDAAKVSLVSTDLITTAAVIKNCQLFISNDSGLMHLAASTGTTTLGLFGPTDETATGPRGKHVHTIRAPDTNPVYNTEHKSNLGQETHSSLQSLTPQFVLDKVNHIM